MAQVPNPLVDLQEPPAEGTSEGSTSSGRDTELEDSRFDSDSAISGLSYASSLTSVDSAFYRSIEEYGRTYHAYKRGKYSFPNDEREQERLDSQHLMTLFAMNSKLYFAPLDPSRLRTALDVATGTGIWAIDFADEFPNCSVLGTDLAPIQPVYVPPNCRFEVDDAEDEWLFNTKFSFIHGRYMIQCFTDNSAFMRKAYDSLEPGGYLELHDASFPLEFVGGTPPDSAMDRWGQLSLQAGESVGKPWNRTKYYPQQMRDAGFINVTERYIRLPVGGWSNESDHEKKIGLMQGKNLMDGIEGFTVKTLSRIGWKEEESRVLAAHVRREIRERKVQAYNYLMVVWGQKPEDPSLGESDPHAAAAQTSTATQAPMSQLAAALSAAPMAASTSAPKEPAAPSALQEALTSHEHAPVSSSAQPAAQPLTIHEPAPAAAEALPAPQVHHAAHIATASTTTPQEGEMHATQDTAPVTSTSTSTSVAPPAPPRAP